MIPTSPDFLLARNPWDAVIDSRNTEEHDCGDGVESNRPFERFTAQDKENKGGNNDNGSCS
jgi:hypothetical protein